MAMSKRNPNVKPHKTLIALGFLALMGCSHPVRDERNQMRHDFRVHCVQSNDYSPRRCVQIKKHILVDDIALDYGTAR